MKKFKWFVIGTGHASEKFVKDLIYLPNHSISHVSSSSMIRAEAFVKDNRLSAQPILHEDISTISGASAVYIASHSNAHFNHVLSAISLGLPILCEKPLALSLGEVERLYFSAIQNKVTLIEGLWTLLLPGVLELKKRKEDFPFQSDWFLKAEFGKQFSYDPKFRLFSNEMSGGSLYDLGIYPIAIANFLLGNLTLEAGEIQRESSGLILDFQAILSNDQQCKVEIRGSIIENLTNALRLERGPERFEIDSPFIGNANVFFQSGSLKQQIYSTENLPGRGLWKEAHFMEMAASNLVRLEIDRLQEISLSTHRILDAINKLDKGDEDGFLD